MVGRPLIEVLDVDTPKPGLTPYDLACWRKRLGLSQAELARWLDVPDSTVSRWERGLMQIASPTILRLALERLESTMQRGAER